MHQSFMQLCINAIRFLKTYIRTLFVVGMVSPNPNHLFGSRRYYKAPIATSRTLLKIIMDDEVLLHQINQIHYRHEHVLILAAVVDGEIRVNAYPVLYDEYYTHYVGMDDPNASGVSSFLFSRASAPPNKRMVVQHVLQQDRSRRYNQYEPEFSWSRALGDMDECVLHRDMFTARAV